MSHDVTCVIPRWGRTFANVMRRFASLSDNRDEIEEVISLVQGGKVWATPDIHEARRKLESLNCPWVSLAPDRKRRSRFFRVGFLAMDISVDSLVLRIEGDEPHNGTSLIKLDEVDFTIVGLDELLAMNHPAIRDPRLVSKWGLYNYNIPTENDLRIAGSASLTSFNTTVGSEITDFVGFFLISARDSFRPTLERLVEQRIPVFVKGRYEELLHSLSPGINTQSVENVEDSVKNHAVGIEIVQTGGTIRRKDLRVIGPPLFISESLYVANYRRYSKNSQLRRLLEVLSPLGYFDESRLEHYIEWFCALEATLGENWVDRPKPDSLFCSLEEMANGLRPYRLKTRRWQPSDDYKREEAEHLVLTSLEKIRRLYCADRSGG